MRNRIVDDNRNFQLLRERQSTFRNLIIIFSLSAVLTGGILALKYQKLTNLPNFLKPISIKVNKSSNFEETISYIFIGSLIGALYSGMANFSIKREIAQNNRDVMDISCLTK